MEYEPPFMSESELSVVIQIVTFNSAATITDCLAGVADQYASLERAPEVIVIDNASTDQTVDLVRAAGYPIHQSPVNRGYAAAHNQALTGSSAALVITLNPDVRLQPGFVAAMCRAFGADMELGSAAGCLLRVDSLDQSPSVIDSAGVYMRRTLQQGLRAEGWPITQRPLKAHPIFGPDGAAAVYRRAMLEDIAYEGQVFDEDFFMHKEDIDLCWRAAWRGWTARYVPDAIATHIRGFRPGQRARVSPRMRYLGVRNRYLLMIKNEPLGHFLFNLPMILFYELQIAVYLMAFERESLRAYASALALLRRMLRKRRAIFASRRVGWSSLRGWFRGAPRLSAEK